LLSTKLWLKSILKLYNWVINTKITLNKTLKASFCSF
jgi:hypothetical protein